MQYAQLLSAGEAEQVHEASQELLEANGILVHNDKARGIFERHGCRVDAQSGIVKIPRRVVEQYRQAFVPTFTFRGRDPQFDKTIPDDSPVIVTASSAPDIIDPITGELRRATSADMANIAYLINELPGYDVFSTSTLAHDAPGGQFSLARFYPALKNCLKPVRGNTPDMQDLKRVLELGAIIAGVPALLVGLTHGGLWGIGKVAIVIIFTNQIESWVLSPRIQGKRMRLNWFVIIIAIFFCAQFLGIVGVLLAIPMLIFFRDFWTGYVQKAFEKI